MIYLQLSFGERFGVTFSSMKAQPPGQPCNGTATRRPKVETACGAHASSATTGQRTWTGWAILTYNLDTLAVRAR
jgi:hypothetical protein